jgi:hypothetical protein
MENGLLVSGGGDGILCLWNWKDGILLDKKPIPGYIAEESAVAKLTSHKDTLMVLLEGYFFKDLHRFDIMSTHF